MIEKLPSFQAQLEEMDALLSSPEVLKDMKRYSSLMQERSRIAPIVETMTRLKEIQEEAQEARELLKGDDAEMQELAKAELEALEEEEKTLEQRCKLLLIPPDPMEGKNIIMEIRAGTGGDEASLFAADLLRMYTHYAESKRWKLEVMNSSESAVGGFKEVVVSISGKDVYGSLRFESGVHRVQRVPETESAGRIHTSAVTVAVLPEAEELEVTLDEKDVRIDLYRSSGAGGQKVNKTETAIRLTHFPTGIVVTCQDERSQLKNREKAFRVLRARLYDYYNGRREGEEAANRRSLVGTGDRSERIRTYNFPQSRITDHRIGLSLHSMENFLAGDLDEMLDALARADREARLAAGE